jgi:NAD(P)-dependent dehydrogenase (short-subunit alcohol dehydrogenase family)
MHALLLGASKGIGHHLLVHLLAEPSNTATLLLRNPACLDADAVVGPAISAGRVAVVAGDATKAEDVRRCFERKVDVVITSVGESSSQFPMPQRASFSY